MSNVKLTPKWCLDAAMLSRPVDLTNLVTMSRNNPEQFVHDQVRVTEAHVDHHNAYEVNRIIILHIQVTSFKLLHANSHVCLRH